jgi:TfuA protein
MTDLIVFSGPTRINGHPERVQFRPPARKGDLRREFLAGYRKFLLVDACFLHSPTPTHAEILWLLQRGAAVHGSGSAGALRAVELETCGMTGSGAVFSSYKAGTITDDGEVGVAMCPITYECLSVPLVNVRATLLRLRDLGLDEEVVRTMFAAAKHIHFMDRTHETLMEQWHRIVPAHYGRVADSWSVNYRDIKSVDATCALAVLSEDHVRGQDALEEEIWHE